MVQASGRASVGEELIALAERHIAAFDTYTEVVNDPAKGHFARYSTEEANRLTVAKYTAAGLTMEKILDFYANLCVNTTKLNKMYTMTKVGEDEGHAVYHNLAKLSFPMSNRSTIIVEYRKEHEGVFTIVLSSKATDSLVAAHQSVIGKNVLARSIIQFARYTPVAGGFEVTTVTASDPAGSIPQFLKDKQATRHANSPVMIA